MSNDKFTFESIKETFSRQSDDYSIKNREPPDDRMDWDSSNENFVRGELHYEEDGFRLDKAFGDTGCHIHVHDGNVELHIFDQSVDDWVSFVFGIDPDEIDNVIEQLECAKEYAIESGSADIRT